MKSSEATRQQATYHRRRERIVPVRFRFNFSIVRASHIHYYHRESIRRENLHHVLICSQLTHLILCLQVGACFTALQQLGHDAAAVFRWHPWMETEKETSSRESIGLCWHTRCAHETYLGLTCVRDEVLHFDVSIGAELVALFHLCSLARRLSMERDGRWVL